MKFTKSIALRIMYNARIMNMYAKIRKNRSRGGDVIVGYYIDNGWDLSGHRDNF